MRSHYKILLLLILMLLCALKTVVAQDTISINNIEKSDTIVMTQPQQTGEQSTTTVVNITTSPVPAKTKSIVERQGDPMKATMLSVVFPGGGQIYNKKYWKLPIVYVGFGALAYAIKLNSDNYQKYYKGYMDFTDKIPETDSYKKFISLPQESYDPVVYPDTEKLYSAQYIEEFMLRAIDANKRYRDLSIILTGVWYIIQILDANVDASLMGYNVSDNLDLALSPTMFNMPDRQSFTGMNLRFTFTF